jgi:hypothetical protein
MFEKVTRIINPLDEEAEVSEGTVSISGMK